MAQFRLCDICGRELNDDLMDYATVTSKTLRKDICTPCMAGSLRITFPNGLTVTGLGALSGDYSPAEEPTPPDYEESPATKDKPKGNNPNGSPGT